MKMNTPKSKAETKATTFQKGRLKDRFKPNNVKKSAPPKDPIVQNVLKNHLLTLAAGYEKRAALLELEEAIQGKGARHAAESIQKLKKIARSFTTLSIMADTL